ncbi:MAG: trigger factor [Deltaproteobacteria bacterium]|nr:trigger factor [Deltaproteobacteria bacterium]
MGEFFRILQEQSRAFYSPVEVPMKVQIENTGPYERKIFFEIPKDVVSREVESQYKTLNRNVKLKGFRPGKVPRSILERYYRTQVETEVVSKLIEDSYGKAVEEYHLAPVAAPQVLDRTFEAGQDFKYTVAVEVKPEFSVGEYRGLTVEKPAGGISEEEVEARLKMVQDSHAQLKPVETDRPLQEKDFAVIDFEGSLDGKPLEGWKVKDHLVEVGSKTLVAGLDQKLAGLPLQQDQDLVIRLPEDYSRKELAGKEVQVRVRAKEIKEKILPALDDELAKEAGDFQTLQGLKDRLRKNLEEQKQAQAAQIAKEKLLDLLREKHPFPVPKSMIDQQVETIMARTESRLARQGVKFDPATLDTQKLRESLVPSAEKEVRASLILEKVAEMENITVSEAEVQQRLEQLAAQMNQRVEAVKSQFQKNDRLEDLRAVMREEKTLDFLLSQANVVEGNSTPEEIK